MKDNQDSESKLWCGGGLVELENVTNKWRGGGEVANISLAETARKRLANQLTAAA